MWHDVPNRGGRININVAERNLGDIGLSSGWQGDQAGRTIPRPGVEYALVPVARNADGSPITGKIIGRIMNASGADSRPLFVYSNPVPYKPQTLDTRAATLTTHTSESPDGRITGEATVPSSDWAWARCSATQALPRRSRFDADLRQERLRSQAALPSRLHGARSVCTRDRLRRVSRRRDVLQDSDAGRLRYSEPARRRGTLDSESGSLAVGQLLARILAARFQ
jgi:hypothetical protein